MSRLSTLLALGRVSNLPTVWSNALAGVALAGTQGAGTWPVRTALLAAGVLSLFYVAGMWLNDAFDAESDAKERPGRPIPSGEIRRAAVFVVGFCLLGLAVGLGFLLGRGAGLAGLALAAAILLYDGLHKRIAAAPVLMGACRFLAYAFAALSAGGLSGPALAGAAGLLCYVVGLTHAARQEAYDRIESGWPLLVLAIPLILAAWQAAVPLAIMACVGFALWLAWCAWLLVRRRTGDVPRAVVGLIAGISLYDAALIAAHAGAAPAGLAILCFGITLLLQRYVAGT